MPAGGVGACEAVHVGFELRGSGRAGAAGTAFLGRFRGRGRVFEAGGWQGEGRGAGTAFTGGLWAPKAMVIAALGTPGAGGAAPWGIP